MKVFDVYRIAKMGIFATIYVVVTLLSSSLSYGQIQFRISEALMLLCFFKKDYIISMTLGCFIANLFSPLGLIDAVFGTVATLIAVILIYVCRERCGLFAVSLFPVITNAVIVAVELKIVYDMPLFVSMWWIALGEFACVSVLGVIIFKAISRNKQFMKLIG